MNDWREWANCLEVPAHYFFPLTKHEEQTAKAVCAGCEVKQDCYEYALTSNRGAREQHGIFGGINFEAFRRDRRTAIVNASRARHSA